MSESVTIQSFPSFSALRHTVPGLAASAGDLFYSLDWFENLATAGFAGQAPLELLLAGDPAHDQRLCLPLVDGRVLTGLSNFYSSLFGPIGENATPPLCAALAAHLRADRRAWPQIRLQPLDTEHPFFQHFAAALRQAGYCVDSYLCFGNWTLAVAGRDFEQYFAALPSRLQNTIRRARKKMEKAGGWQFSLHTGAGDDLDTAIAAFEAIYADSWKEAEAFPQFIPALCRMAAARGWLRLGLLQHGGRPIAAQLWLVKDGKASIFKLAYRQGEAGWSPGSVLTAELMRQVIDVDRVGEVDFLSGDDAYKQDWMSHRRERRGLVAFRLDRALGLAAAARHYLGKFLRSRKTS